jgi:hypothetical protein
MAWATIAAVYLYPDVKEEFEQHRYLRRIGKLHAPVIPIECPRARGIENQDFIREDKNPNSCWVDLASFRRNRWYDDWCGPGSDRYCRQRANRSASHVAFDDAIIERTEQPETLTLLKLRSLLGNKLVVETAHSLRMATMAYELDVVAKGALAGYGLNYREFDVGVVFATDGRVSASELAILRDDLSFFPSYLLAPVVRKSTLERFPHIKAPLEKLAAQLDNETMAALNAAVDLQGRKVEEVASDFLRSRALLSGP